MTPDAYDLLKQGLFLWQQNALRNNDATEIKKKAFEIPLNVKTPEGIWEINNVKYDPTYGILFECNIKPYTSNE
jgi:hypothetical protein